MALSLAPALLFGSAPNILGSWAAESAHPLFGQVVFHEDGTYSTQRPEQQGKWQLIEPSAEAIAAGSPAFGTLILRTSVEETRYGIGLRDDGVLMISPNLFLPGDRASQVRLLLTSSLYRSREERVSLSGSSCCGFGNPGCCIECRSGQQAVCLNGTLPNEGSSGIPALCQCQ